MIYAIIGILFIVALFLIFRNDHDNSYNRNEKKAQRQSDGARRQRAYSMKDGSHPKSEATFRPKAEKKEPSLKEQILSELEAAFQEMKKDWEATGPQTDVDEQFPEDE